MGPARARSMAHRGLRRNVTRSRAVAAARPGPTVHLVRMTAAERDEALRQEAIEYAEAKARAGFWSREESLARAQQEIAGLVGPNPEKRGHAFFVALDEADRQVGWVWHGPVPGSKTARGRRWLFQIVVDEPRRGKGYGRGLLRSVERQLRRDGVRELYLNVFRWNEVALALYRRSGYEVVSEGERNLQMRKRLTQE